MRRHSLCQALPCIHLFPGLLSNVVLFQQDFCGLMIALGCRFTALNCKKLRPCHEPAKQAVVLEQLYI